MDMENEVNVLMNIRTEAFARQFPWLRGFLKDIIDESLGLKSIKIEVVDLNLWERKLFFRVERNVIGCEHKVFEDLYAIDMDGGVLGAVGFEKLGKKYSWWDLITIVEFFKSNDTLKKLFERLGYDGRKIRYVVSLWGGRLVIYKVPHRLTIKEKVEIDREKKRIEKDQTHNSDKIKQKIASNEQGVQLEQTEIKKKLTEIDQI